MKKIILSSLLVLGLSTAAFAQDAAATPDFASADTDANGAISLEEAKAALPGLTDEAFRDADIDEEDGLSPDEFAQLVAANSPAASTEATPSS